MSAMGRPRGGRFSDRPENVEITTVGAVTYFRYVMPDGERRPIGNSRDAKTAYDKAHALNGYFAQQRLGLAMANLVQPPAPKVSASPTNPTIPTLIDEFKRHDPKRKKYSARTLDELDYKLAQYAREWATKTVKEMATTDFATFLNGLTDNAYVKHRAALLRLMQFAGHQGYRADNPVAITLEKEEAAKVRQRHTWEGVQKILAAETTPVWLRRAIRIGLYSLQRADDVVNLHKVRNKIDLAARTMEVAQRKTRNYKVPVYIEIEMGPELLAVVEECLKSEILCPFLVHRQPDKISEEDRQAKEHPFAVLRGYLSRAFSDARDACHAYEHLKPEERPTYHELRSLGVHLYQQAGYDDAYLMALSGHAKPETLELYKRDHAGIKPKRVQAGLSAGQLPK
jgi:hypothetical protein